MNDGFVGLDPVGCREFASRWEEAALESLALADEYREIGRVGLMEAEFAVVVSQLTEVHDELQSAVKILRSKSDEVEALERRWLGIADVPKPSSRSTGRYTPKRTDVSAPPPAALAFRAQVGSDSAGPSKPSTSSPTSTPKMSSPDAKVKVPAGAKSQVPTTGDKKPTGTPAKPAPTPPKKMGPPAPKAVPSFRPGPGNWAGVSPELLASGQKLADSIVPGLENTNFSDSEINDLAGWWWSAQQSGDQKKLQRLVTGLSIKDRNRLELAVGYYDWYAYSEAEKKLPPDFPKVMEFLSTDEAKQMSSEQLAVEVQKILKVTDPMVLDAVKTYIHYQVGTGRHLMNAHAGWNDRLVEGWFLPTLVPEEWTKSLAQSNQDWGVATADQIELCGDAIAGLLQGKVLGNYDRRFVVIATPITGEQSTWPFAILAGIVVAALVAFALPEAAAITALTAAFGGTAAAGVAATVIVVACTGAIAGVSAKVAEKFVLALAGEKDWDDVIDAGELGREALLGGMLSVAFYGIGRAIGKGLAFRAARQAAKLKREAEIAELTAKLAKQTADNAALEKKIVELEEKLAKTKAEIKKVDEEIAALKKAEAEAKKAQAEIAKKQAKQPAAPSVTIKFDPKVKVSATGVAEDALANVGRVDHASRHLVDKAGVLPGTAGSQLTRGSFQIEAKAILENPVKTFEHVMARNGKKVTGFVGKVNGKDVVIFIAREPDGKIAIGQIVTAVIPTPQQAINWGIS